MFKSPQKREQYNRLMAAYVRKDKLLFNADGTQNRNNSFAANFWAGYNGVEGVLFNPYSSQYRSTASYVFYRAGADCRKQENNNVS